MHRGVVAPRCLRALSAVPLSLGRPDASAGADTCGNGNNGATAEFRADFDIDADATIDVNVPTSMLMRPSESWADSDASWADIAPDAGADSGDTCRCAAVAESKSMSAHIFDR